MPDYRRIVTQAYREILDREPDPGGLAAWNDQMNHGLTEAAMRESFLRSSEYAERFPGAVPPPPPPPPPADGSMALRVEGNRFVLAATGAEVKLLGIGGVCCTETAPDGSNPAKVAGWPLVSDAQLDLIAAHRGNFIHVRTGPFTVEGEGPGFSGYVQTAPDGRYDLDRWDEAYWTRLADLCARARRNRVWVEVDLLDGWMVRNGNEDSPYVAAHNVQGENYVGCDVFKSSPPARFLAWVTQVVTVTGIFDNVLYQLGNENFACRPAPEYEAGLAAIVRQVEAAHGFPRGFPRHLIGSNTADDSTPFDYIERHASEAQYPLAQPLMVNEYDDQTPSLTPEAFAVEAAAANRWGTSFHLWMGQQSPDEWQRSLALLEQIAAGTRPPIPASCPPLVRWKAGVFSVMDPAAQLIPDKQPVADGFVRLDSTPFFQGPSGPGKCNTEGDVCSGRRCEDPRGGVWRQLEGPEVTWHVSNPGPETGYSVNIGGIARRGTIPLSPGTYVFEVRPSPDAHDGEIPSRPLEIVGDVKGRVTFTVVP